MSQAESKKERKWTAKGEDEEVQAGKLKSHHTTDGVDLDYFDYQQETRASGIMGARTMRFS